MKYSSGYKNVEVQSWVSWIGDWLTLVAAGAAFSFTFAVFLGWQLQVIPDINNLKSRANGVDALISTPGGPLYVDRVAGTVTIGCNGDPTQLCLFVSETKSNYTSLQTQVNNLNVTGGGVNVTLSTLNYTNSAPFMSGVSNGKNSFDALVDKDIAQDTAFTNFQNQTNNTFISFQTFQNQTNTTFISFQTQLTTITNTVNNIVTNNGTISLNTLPYNNSAPFMAGGTTGKDGLDNLVIEVLAQGAQIDTLIIANNETVSLNTLPYNNSAPFMASGTTGKDGLDNLVIEVLSQGAQIDALIAAQQQTEQTYRVLNFARLGTPTINSSHCLFTVDLSSGAQYVTGSSLFQRGSGTLVFNGSATQGFDFHFSSKLFYSATNMTATIMYIQPTLLINSITKTTIADFIPVQLTNGVASIDFTTPLFLPPSSVFSMTLAFYIQMNAIVYLDCGISHSMQYSLFSLIPFTTPNATSVLTPSLSYASGNGIASAYQNYFASFMVTTVDQFANQFYAPTAAVAGTASTTTMNYTVSFVSGSNGTYIGTYLPTTDEDVTLSVNVNGTAIASSPISGINVLNSCHAPYCSLSSSTTEPVGPIVWTFTMVDININPVLDFHDNFVFVITNSYVIGGLVFEQQSPGVGQVAFYAPTFGTMEFRIDIVNDVNTLTMAGTPSFTVFS
jgi:hypothetical protein